MVNRSSKLSCHQRLELRLIKDGLVKDGLPKHLIQRKMRYYTRLITEENKTRRATGI